HGLQHRRHDAPARAASGRAARRPLRTPLGLGRLLRVRLRQPGLDDVRLPGGVAVRRAGAALHPGSHVAAGPGERPGGAAGGRGQPLQPHGRRRTAAHDTAVRLLLVRARPRPLSGGGVPLRRPAGHRRPAPLRARHARRLRIFHSRHRDAVAALAPPPALCRPSRRKIAEDSPREVAVRRRAGACIAVAVAVALLGAATPGIAGATLPPVTDEWIRVKTAHFVLYSNASERRTLDLGRRLERFRAALARFNRKFVVDPPVVTSLFIFRDDASLTPYKTRFNGRAVEMSGLFVGRSDGNYILVNGAKQGDPLEV